MKEKKKYLKGIAMFIVISLVLSMIYAQFNQKKTEPKEITYNEFLTEVDKGNVGKLYYEKDVVDVKAELKDGSLVTFRKPIDNFDEKLMLGGIEILPATTETQKALGKLGSLLGGYVMMLLVMMIFIRFATKGAMKGQTSALNMKVPVQKGSKVKFIDVAGNDEAKEELMELIDFIKNPHKFKRYGAKAPRGTLLTGPPGNGKTLMAKALAGEAEVPFLSVSGSDFVQMYVGLGANRVRELFAKAKEMAPCIIFIDEIDALGRKRSGGGNASSDERDQTLNQLLVEMDGFNETNGIIVLAATNRPELLDDALLRPGRFDRQTSVSLPDIEAREKILAIHSKGKPLGKDVNFKEVAKLTTFMSGADLMNVMNEASIYAAKQDHKGILMEDINKAISKVLVGEERRNDHGTQLEKEITAYHEAGHAIIAKLVAKKGVPKVTIIPTTKGAGGYTLIDSEENAYETKRGLLNDISVALGGRAAEELVFGEDNITGGASQDLKVVTSIAERMVKSYGMNKSVGLINLHELYKDSYGGSSNDVAVKEIRELIETSYDQTLTILEENKDILENVSQYLLKYETIYEDDLDNILLGVPYQLIKNDKEENKKLEEEIIEEEIEFEPELALKRRLLG